MAVSDEVQRPSAAAGPAFPEAPAHYAFRARLGEGGHGEVYEAWDSKLQRSVAVKRIKHDGSASGADLIREARMAASLRHPAFVKVHAIEESGGNQFIVMELVPGRTLKQVLADGKPDLDAALDWVRQVAEAMRDAHASGLVHGDLKPSNLMIEPDGTVRILDFGLALRQDMLETTTLTQSEPQGTIAYMAPERLLGGLPDARGDIYALGVILYEMAIGSRPFSTLNGLALAAAHMQSSSDSWPYPDDLSTPLIALIRAMTARQPEHRLMDMNEILLRLGHLGRPPATRSGESRDAQPILAARRHFHRSAVWIGGIALVCSLAAGVAWWQAGSDGAALRNVFTPYSEAKDVEAGLVALKLYDRPGELKRAEEHFNRILERSPDSATAVAGMSLVQTRRYMSDQKDEAWLQKAYAGAQLALKLNDQLALSHIAMAAVLDCKRDFDRGLKAYEQALQLDPGNFLAWYGKVDLLRNARRYPDALETISLALKRFPKESIFLDELATIKFEQRDYADAEKLFLQSIAMQPDAVTSYANLSAIYLYQNRSEEALRVLQQGLQVRPSGRLYSNLGNTLFIRGDYVGAAKAFENAVSPAYGSPSDYVYWANLGDTLLWLPGRKISAQRAYEKAKQFLSPQLARSPNEPGLVSRMGLYSARAGDSVAGTDMAKRAIALAPRDPAIRFRAGLSFELSGQRQLAVAAIVEARRLGYPASLIEAEPDLIALRRDPAYQSN